MGRHSRRGDAPRSAEDTVGATGAGAPPAEAGSGRRRRSSERPGQVRGGHPEQPEWDRPGPERYGVQHGPRIPGPRREFVEAFEAPAFEAPASEASSAGGPVPRSGEAGPVLTVPKPDPARRQEPAGRPIGSPGGPDDPQDSESGEGGKGGKGRTFTGIAAAAVITVLAIVVAGQVADGGAGRDDARASGALKRGSGAGPASRGDARTAPGKASAAPATYEQKMAKLYPLDPKLAASGAFAVVPGSDKAPGKGHKYTYRVDIEKGMALDGALFAEAVQKTLNDKRSWAHNGDMTFARISTGHPDFVMTLASPVTTAKWCAKSGLDTLDENVSCDSAATDRVMINAYRWARGSSTFGDAKIFAYRQMLINHETGHRLGHNHVTCRTPGALAPVMQQQTKSLDIGGIKCRANPWVYPTA
ncbi:DUF3152 domain-containing protein [Streptomyces sp. NPDC051320]|uniref:DUF3152 domain-containing protein n=1 Tax=Streptomyces sp. NPDC051320 TaxID=3154644 RepID=UPI003432BDD7